MRKKRTNIYIEYEQNKVLKSLGGTVAGHIRRAIDEYIERHTSKITSSPSKLHGTIYRSPEASR